jgi:ammonia channel protein AmtB
MKRHTVINAFLVIALLALMMWWSFVPVSELSDEGARLLGRVALVSVILLLTAVARTIVGRHPSRQRRMLLGTLGGLTAGIAAATPLSQAFGTDVSTLSAIAGVFLGWTVAYVFVKRLPRNA